MGKPRGQREHDTEIDRREWAGHTIVLLEDRSMMKPDGTSGQYVIAIEVVSKEGNKYFAHKRYVSDLMRKKGYANAREGARAVFMDPGGFTGILGDFRADRGAWEEYSAAV